MSRRSRSCGKSIHQACKDAGITDVTDYRLLKGYGSLKGDWARRLKVLERENQRLKRVMADAPNRCRFSGLPIICRASSEADRLRVPLLHVEPACDNEDDGHDRQRPDLPRPHSAPSEGLARV